MGPTYVDDGSRIREAHVVYRKGRQQCTKKVMYVEKRNPTSADLCPLCREVYCVRNKCARCKVKILAVIETQRQERNESLVERLAREYRDRDALNYIDAIPEMQPPQVGMTTASCSSWIQLANNVLNSNSRQLTYVYTGTV